MGNTGDTGKYGKSQKKTHLRAENARVPTSSELPWFQELRSSDLPQDPKTALFTPHDPSGNPMIATSREKW